MLETSDFNPFNWATAEDLFSSLVEPIQSAKLDVLLFQEYLLFMLGTF